MRAKAQLGKPDLALDLVRFVRGMNPPLKAFLKGHSRGGATSRVVHTEPGSPV